MEQSASDAANAGAMVVHTTEDNPVSDGDPICELARGEREIGEEREGRERGKRGRRYKKSIRLFDSPCRRCAAASHFLRCAQFVQHLSSSLHCCCCFTSRTHLHTGLVFFTHPPPHRLTKLPLLPLPASKNVSFSPRPATLLFLAPCFLTRRRRCWGWAGPPRQVSTRPTGKLSAYEPAPPMLAAVAPPMLAAAVAPLFFSGSAHCSHRYERARRLACCPQKAEKVSILPRPKGICDRHAKP